VKKVFALGAILLFLFTLLVGCNYYNEEIDSSNSPRLFVNLKTGELPVQNFRAAQGTTSWFLSYQASGFHPLCFWTEMQDGTDFNEFIGRFEDISEGEIQLQFSHFPPDTVVVRKWRAEFIGMTSQMKNRYELVEVNHNVIRINDKGYDYIYEVQAIWEQRNDMSGTAKAFYTFRIDSGRR